MVKIFIVSEKREFMLYQRNDNNNNIQKHKYSIKYNAIIYLLLELFLIIFRNV